MISQTRRWTVLVLAVLLALGAAAQLERFRADITMTPFTTGTTPATLYRGSEDGPLVIVAHGFAGSRQLMEALSLTLARAGFRVAAFDFEGHGRNPVPMSGDVTVIEGTTARLVEETGRVIARAREITGYPGPIGLVGHSMASDIVIRAALSDPSINGIVAISMYSEAVTAAFPQNLLIVTGAWEPPLRRVGLEALRLVDPMAEENQTAQAGEIRRRAVVSPFVEHVGVLYSRTTLTETRDWLRETLNHPGASAPATTGPWVLLLMGTLVLLVRPVSRLMPVVRDPRGRLTKGQFALALVGPGLVAAAVTVFIPVSFLPVLVADALALHLAIMGGMQLACLGWFGRRPVWNGGVGLAVLLILGLGVFGLAMDRYVASFLPTAERLPIIAVLALGTLPFMLADAMLSEAGRARLWRRIALRATLLISLSVAIAFDPERLFFIALIFPVLILFYCVHVLMGRWIGQRTGAMAPGLALGLILAWALGVSFPMFAG